MSDSIGGIMVLALTLNSLISLILLIIITIKIHSIKKRSNYIDNFIVKLGLSESIRDTNKNNTPKYAAGCEIDRLQR